ncbi:MAG: hypothetical protein AABX93_01775 [Nanoarchaeota archaeon]
MNKLIHSLIGAILISSCSQINVVKKEISARCEDNIEKQIVDLAKESSSRIVMRPLYYGKKFLLSDYSQEEMDLKYRCTREAVKKINEKYELLEVEEEEKIWLILIRRDYIAFNN